LESAEIDRLAEVGGQHPEDAIYQNVPTLRSAAILFNLPKGAQLLCQEGIIEYPT
jgi:hypothetical protein